MKKIFAVMIGIVLLATGGCLHRISYYEPSEKTMIKGKDNLIRGPVKEEGAYPIWSESPGKNFANPSFSVIGK